MLISILKFQGKEQLSLWGSVYEIALSRDRTLIRPFMSKNVKSKTLDSVFNSLTESNNEPLRNV